MKPKMIVPEAPQTVNPLIHKPINRTMKNPDSIEAMTRDQDKAVTGTFVNIECPGQPAKISGKLYKGMEYFTKTFTDGERCTIPLSIARMINERINHNQHSYLLDGAGNPIKSDKQISRYKFMTESY